METIRDVLEWMQIQDPNGDFLEEPAPPLDNIRDTLEQWRDDLGHNPGPKTRAISKALEIVGK